MQDDIQDASSGPEPLFSPLIEQATELSAQWHDRTYRKSRWREEAFSVPASDYLKVPVVAHLATVALTVQRVGWDEVTVAAAFLHDVIEDGNYLGHRFPYDDLVRLIGEAVADLVREVSEHKFDERGNPRPWQDRKTDYIEQLRTATDRAVAISLADKLHNLWTINESLEAGVDVFSPGDNRRPLQGSVREQSWFFSSVCAIAAERTDPRLRALRLRLKEEILRFAEHGRTS